METRETAPLFFHQKSFNFLASLINGNKKKAKGASTHTRSFNFLASLINGNERGWPENPFWLVSFNFLASLINGNDLGCSCELFFPTHLLTS